MMKKLSVFVLVLAMVSASNAALSLKIVDNANGTFGVAQTVNFIAPDDNTYWLALSANAANYPHGGAIQAGAPAQSQVGDGALTNGAPVPAGWDGVWGEFTELIVPPPTKTIAPGTYAAGMVASMGDTIRLYQMNAEWTQITLLDTVTLVPEPMTLALLGLGGLFLRRRK